MAVSTPLELLQCLSLSFMAKNYRSGLSEDALQEKWERMFDAPMDEKALRKECKDHLGENFKYSVIVEKYQSTLTGVTKQVKVKEPVRIIYLTTIYIIERNIIGNLADYFFLDQNDEFTQAIKDTALTKIKKATEFGGKIDLLSSVDFFAVKKSSRTKVLADYTKHVVAADEKRILLNMVNNTNTYRNITEQYFRSAECVGISLKKMSKLSGVPNFKIYGISDADEYNEDYVDPYTRVIAHMMAHPDSVESIIKKLVNIEFQNFRITSDLQSWRYPVTFDYENIGCGDVAGFKSASVSLRFELSTWNPSGFNGQWFLKNGGMGPWVSGIGIGPAQDIFIKYAEYGQIAKELAEKRTKVLRRMMWGVIMTPLLKKAYDDALKELSGEKILPISMIKKTLLFFESYVAAHNGKGRIDPTYIVKKKTKEELEEDEITDDMEKKKSKSKKQHPILNVANQIHQFYDGVIRELAFGVKTNFNKNATHLAPHFQQAQLAYFLLRAGRENSSVEYYLKQRIFLSIFGVLTKSVYKIFEGGSKTEMKNYVALVYKKNQKRVEAYFSAAPYILLTES